MATVIQYQALVFLAKCHRYNLERDKREALGATMFQTAYRGLSGRWEAAARRRVRETNAAIYKRRRRTGAILRALGARNRMAQATLNAGMEALGIDPASFTLFLGCVAVVVCCACRGRGGQGGDCGWRCGC